MRSLRPERFRFGESLYQAMEKVENARVSDAGTAAGRRRKEMSV